MMVVSLLVDDDDDEDDGKGSVKARGLGLLRGMDASLNEKDGSKGFSGQDVVEGWVTGLGDDPDGLSKSGRGEDDWAMGGPSKAPRSERFCSRYWSGIVRGKGGGAWRYNAFFLGSFCFDLSFIFLLPSERLPSSPPPAPPPLILIIDPLPVSQPYRSDKVEEALLWNCSCPAAEEEEEEGFWCCELERERAEDDVVVVPDLSDPDERSERE